MAAAGLRERLLAEHEEALKRGPAAQRALFEIALGIAPLVIVSRLIEPWFPMPFWGPIAVIVCVAVASILLRHHGQSWQVLGLRRPVSWPRVALGVVAMYAALGVAITVTQAVLARVGVAPADHTLLREWLADPLTLALFLGPVAWGAAAFGEEMLLRGFIFDRLEQAMGGGANALAAAIIAQAFLFGWLHRYQGVGGAALVAVYGLVAGAAYLLAGRNLWVVIIVHGLVDTIALLAIRGGLL